MDKQCAFFFFNFPNFKYDCCISIFRVLNSMENLSVVLMQIKKWILEKKKKKAFVLECKLKEKITSLKELGGVLKCCY